ncbi:acyl carrier protein [Anaerosporobacter faecicola]|uniref:acyl carrier protein n=1 Tax=Anaerosporobacter faecicola TaxID=2718714 RepID=UPI00143A467E|nr:acyl carrier protein [Anaerosporobacter faecicola]
MNEKELLKEFLKKEIFFSEEEFSDSQQLIDSGMIDSISIVKVIIFIEKNFGVSFSEDDMSPENFETLQAMLNTIELKRSKLKCESK